MHDKAPHGLEELTGVPAYICKRCGQVCIIDAEKPAPYTVLTDFVLDPNLQVSNGVRRQIVHICMDRGAGIATLEGMETPERVEFFKKRMEAIEAAHVKAVADGAKSPNN